MIAYSSKLLGAGKQSCVPAACLPIPYLWGVKWLTVMLKKNVRHSSDSCLGQKEPDPPSWAAILPQLPCVSAYQLQRGKVLFCLAGLILCRPCGRAHPITGPIVAQASAQRGLSGYASSCLWPVTDCTACLRHTAFPEPLEKRAFYVKCPEVVYHLIVLFITLIFPPTAPFQSEAAYSDSKHINTLTHWATQLRLSLNPSLLYHMGAMETSTPGKPQVLDRREAEASWSSSSQPPPLLIQPECMFIHPEKAKCLRYIKVKRMSWN